MSALNSLKEKTVLLRTGSRPRTLFNLRTNMNKKSSLLDSVSALKQKGLTVALCQYVRNVACFSVVMGSP